MADEKTKAELVEENKVLRETVDKFQNAGQHDLSWYQKELDAKGKEIELLRANLDSKKEKEHLQKIEAEVLKADQEREKVVKLAQYNQTEHTRFRLRENHTRLDIFGNVGSTVFDLGVNLRNFRGPIYIPVGIVIEMGQSIGMLTIDEANTLKKDLAYSNAKNEKAALLASELTDGISVLTDKFYADLDSVVFDPDTDDQVDYVDESTESNSGDGTESESDNGSDKADGQTDGDNSVEGSDGISDDSDDADNTDAELDRLLGKSD